MMNQTAKDFDLLQDVIWFDDDDTVNYGIVAGWSLYQVAVIVTRTDVPQILLIDPQILCYF